MILPVLLSLVVLLTLLLRYGIFENWPNPRRYYYSLSFPGPSGTLGLGLATTLVKLPPKDMMAFLFELKKTYQRLVSFYVGMTLVFVLFEPDDIQRILSTVAHSTKSISYKPLGAWLREGLLTSNGEKWKSRRKLLTPAFHFRILEDSLIGMNRNAARLVAKLTSTNEEPTQLDDFVFKCSLNLMTETAMGVSLDDMKDAGEEYISSVKWSTRELLERIVNLKYYKDYPYFWLARGREFLRRIKIMHSFAEKVIRERREKLRNEQVYPDKKKFVFLDCLLENEAQNPGSWTDEDIREEVDTFMFEGHDTTAMSTIFSLFSIGTYPDVQAMLQDEMEEIFGDSDREATMEDVEKIFYLEKVIKETLRLYPSVQAVMRKLNVDCELEDGLIIPSGSNITIPALVIHKDPKYFPDPDKFDPERFSEDQVAARHPFAYLPFSAGPRNCIGQKFAKLELKVVLSSVIRKFHIKTITQVGDFQIIPQLIIKSSKPITCQFIRRE